MFIHGEAERHHDRTNDDTSYDNIMCFTETFFKPHQHIGAGNKEYSEVFRLDHVATSTQDLSNGGIKLGAHYHCTLIASTSHIQLYLK